jgi:hypothetical protein
MRAAVIGGLLAAVFLLGTCQVQTSSRTLLPDGEVLSHFDLLGKVFHGNDFSLSIDGQVTRQLVVKKTRIVEEDGVVENTYDLDGLVVSTHYRELKPGKSGKEGIRVKQVVTLSNPASQDRTATYTTWARIPADKVTWDGKSYTLTSDPKVFRAFKKTASILDLAEALGKGDMAGLESFKNYEHTYTAGSHIVFEADGGRGVYDWSDAVHLNPEVRVYRTTQGAFLEFVVDDLKVPAGGQAVIDPIYGFDNPADYDLRYDGYVEIKWLTDNGLLIGDINGDS